MPPSYQQIISDASAQPILCSEHHAPLALLAAALRSMHWTDCQCRWPVVTDWLPVPVSSGHRSSLAVNTAPPSGR